MLAIDHMVIAVNDPAKEAERFGKMYDVLVVEGGKHGNWGTFNHLAYFQNDCYIEWIGLFDRKVAVQSDNPLIHDVVAALDRNEEGVVQLAFRTDQSDAYVEHFKREGIDFTGPIPGRRKKPDGSSLEWQMLFPHSDSEAVLPFLIEWGKVKNVPSDESLINPKELNMATVPVSSQHKFSSIYKLEFKAGEASLANARLGISSQLSFSIG